MRRLIFWLISIYPLLLSAQQSDSTISSITLYASLSSSLPITQLSFAAKPFRQMMASTQFHYNSSFADIGFVRNILNNKFIDVSTKDRQLKRMYNANNKLMYAMDYALQYSWKKDSSYFTHQVSVSDRSLIYAETSRDLYRFLMYGNGPEANVMSFNYNELFNTRYRQFNYSLFYKPLKNLVVYGSIGLLQGLNYNHAYLSQTYLETGDYGEQINIKYRFTYAGIDKEVKPWSMHYSGFSINGGAIFSSNPTRYQAWVGFSDLSSINTRPYTKVYGGIGQVTFEGIEVANLFNITDTTFNNIDTDSLLRFFNIRQVQVRTTDALPFNFHVGYKRHFDNGFVLQVQAIYYTNLLYHNPLVIVTAGKKTGSVETSLTGSIGGYRQAHLGCQFLIALSKHFDVFVRSTAIEGLLLPKHSTAMNASFAMLYHF